VSIDGLELKIDQGSEGIIFCMEVSKTCMGLVPEPKIYIHHKEDGMQQTRDGRERETRRENAE